MGNDLESVRWLHTPSKSSKEDYRFAGPVQQCLCGGDMFHALVGFDDSGDVAYYVVDGMCWQCGAVVTLPTPLKPSAFAYTEDDEAGDEEYE